MTNAIFAAESICTPNAGQVIVRFTYGSEKQSWIQEVTAQFNQEKPQTASEKRICVQAIPKGSGDSVNEIMNGAAGADEIHATSPASDLYVNLINYENEAQRGKELLKIQGFLVSSPVVIAAWENAIAKFGAAQAIGWRELFNASRTVTNLRYGQTNPEKSNSGLSALVAQFYAGAEASEGHPVTRLSESKIAEPAVLDFVKRVHEGVIHYGESTGFYARKMREGGPQYADAVVIYESDVIQANNYIRDHQTGYPLLKAIYPQEGTFATNHPFTIVQRDWVDADEEQGAQKYFEFLMSPPIQAQALQYGFRPSVALDIDRKIYDIVWNERNGVQPYSTIHKFLVTPTGKVIKAIRDAFRQIKKKSLVVLVLDKSGSMTQKVFDKETARHRSRMEMAIESAKLLISRLQPRDRVSLVLYDHDAYYSRATPKGQPLSMDSDGQTKLNRTLDFITPSGNTALRDAVNYAWDDLCQDSKTNPNDFSIRVVIVLTDGLDNESKITNDALIEKIGFSVKRPNGTSYWGDARCKIPVFGMAFGIDADERELKRISEATGGESKKGDVGDIRLIFDRFTDLL